MTKYQLDLFSIIATFPDGVVNVKNRQIVLIIYLDNQNNNYISIWFKISHEYQNDYTKIINSSIRKWYEINFQNSIWSFIDIIPPLDQIEEAIIEI